MSMPKLMATMMKLHQEIDVETIGLLAKFGEKALQSGDPRGYLRAVLKAVVEAPEVDGAQTIEVQVLPAKKGS